MTIDDSAEQPGTWPRAEDVLTLPSDTSALDTRADELASTPFADHLARTELAAICRLRLQGRLTGQELLELTAKDLHLHGLLVHQPDREEVVRHVQNVQLALWSNLEQLVRGELVTFEPVPDPANPHEAYLHESDPYHLWFERLCERTRSWWETVMADLTQALRERLSPPEVVRHLPSAVVDEMKWILARELFDSVYGVGASLQSQPTPSASSLGRPIKETGVWVADALARAVLRAISELEEAIAGNNTDEARTFGRHLMLWWGLLKGYTFDAARTNRGQILTAVLGGWPQIVTRICEALEQGQKALSRHEVPTSEWVTPETKWATKIAQTPTSEVITEFRARIDEWNHFAEAMKTVR